MKQTDSAYKLQPPGNYPKESIQNLEHGESLKLRIYKIVISITFFGRSVMSKVKFSERERQEGNYEQ
jgi:hypothetical protein